ncbi:hypothetical protein ACE1B6_00545 [Aerosakkonemataceae cyanobacterium BLCC-F154]|uniref:Uncharacterized protein n=1 Tax=Floridaenema fluviatile BLCC-F154 TaxID=3153640 RepID=A0ABV4Y4J0_9CYAN
MSNSLVGLKRNSKKVLSLVLGLGVLASINVGNIDQATAIQCNISAPELPSRNVRVYKDSRYGFQIEIPANYRVMQLPAGAGGQYSIGIFDPNGYREMVCLLRNKVPTDSDPASIIVTIDNTNSFIQNLRESLSRGYTTRPIEKNGRLIYTGMGEETTLNISQSYKNRFVVTFSASIGTNNSIIMESVLKQVLNSFQ